MIKVGSLLDGYGYGDWKDIDENKNIQESIFINVPGLYHVHIKFRNPYGGESQAFVRNYLVDWIKPEIITEKKIKRQSATTNGSFTIVGFGEDNLSPVLYNSGKGWNWYTEGEDITFDNLSPGYNILVAKFSDLNGNIVEEKYEIWYLNH